MAVFKLRGKETEIQDRSHMCWFKSQMPMTVWSKLRLKQGGENSSYVSHMGVKTQLLELPSPRAVHIGQKLESGAELWSNLGTLIWDAGILLDSLIARPKLCCKDSVLEWCLSH